MGEKVSLTGNGFRGFTLKLISSSGCTNLLTCVTRKVIETQREREGERERERERLFVCLLVA